MYDDIFTNMSKTETLYLLLYFMCIEGGHYNQF
jgi:hypothetical protein